MRGKLFIPGPTYVTKENRKALLSPPPNHRSADFADVLEDITENAKKLFYTEGDVFMLAISARGAMEGAVLNCVQSSVLNVVNGAFGQLWHKISKATGKEAKTLEIPWGKAVRAEDLEAALATTSYEAVTLVHNESSTGVANPLEELADVMTQHPDTLFLVDTVSSFGGVKIEVDALGIDVCVTGTQKCLALDPGLSLVSVSERAMRKSETVKNKGYYLDFIVQKEYLEKGQPVPTPPLPQVGQLRQQLHYILEEEGLERRYTKHEEMAGLVQNWARRRFGLYAEEGFLSKTLTVVQNPKKISIKGLNTYLQEEGVGMIADGYGPLKGDTFRIGHMGDLDYRDLLGLLSSIDKYFYA